MSRAGKVLIIDDDIAVRLRLGDLLAQTGDFEIHETESGPDGLRVARAVVPDLILLDIMMPGMTGYEVCAALRADPVTREVPVIVLSAAEESEAMIAALDAGADDFLRKPFSSPELRAKVRTITRVNRFRALAQERDRFRWLLDHSLEPLIIADGRGALVYANERARTVFALEAGTGEDVATAIGRHFRAEPADAWAAWRELRSRGGDSFAVFQPESAQVAARWFTVELHALDGEGSQTLLKFTNRTDAVRRELETFTFQHLISHKIRTPLNGLAPILSFLEATDDASLGAETAGMLSLARASAERLESTLLAILNYHSAVFAPGTPGPDTCKPLADILQLAAQSAGLKDRVRLSGPAGAAAHAEMLEVVLTELLENYGKFSDAGRAGVAADLAAAAGGGWELRLFAPGPSLPPEVVAGLGRPYTQLERSFSGEVPGIGLGLATVRLLLRTIGGDITFANSRAESGLLITVSLPARTFTAFPGPAHEPASR